MAALTQYYNSNPKFHKIALVWEVGIRVYVHACVFVHVACACACVCVWCVCMCVCVWLAISETSCSWS